MSRLRLVAICLAAVVALLLGASLIRERLTEGRGPAGAAATASAPGPATADASKAEAVKSEAAKSKDTSIASAPAAGGLPGVSAGTLPDAGRPGVAALAPASAMPATGLAKADEEAPAFDVVRIEPDGEAVIAGRAPAGATVELLRSGKVHDRVVADPSGLFAMTPPAIPPGEHELTLRFTTPDGRQAIARQSVTVGIAADKKTRPLIALTAPGAPTVVLSKPETPTTVASAEPKPPTAGLASPDAAKAAAASMAPGVRPSTGAAPPKPGTPVAVDAVEAEDGGKLYVSGRAAPGATLRLYLNDTYLASGATGPDGKAGFSIAGGVKPGDYKVRLDEADPTSGKVKTRAEVAFTSPAPPIAGTAPVRTADAGTSAAAAPVVDAVPGAATARAAATTAPVQVPEVKTAQVTRGDSLWRISRKVYGQGMRYTVIYGANDAQIRDPNLIFPGQVFVLPGKDG